MEKYPWTRSWDPWGERNEERKFNDTPLWTRRWRFDGITFNFYTGLPHIYFPNHSFIPVLSLPKRDWIHDTSPCNRWRKLLVWVHLLIILSHFTYGYCHLHVPVPSGRDVHIYICTRTPTAHGDEHIYICTQYKWKALKCQTLGASVHVIMLTRRSRDSCLPCAFCFVPACAKFVHEFLTHFHRPCATYL